MLLAAVVAAAIQQAAVAFGWLELGSLPGDEPPLSRLVVLGIVALLAGAIPALAIVRDPRDRWANALLAALGFAAAGFVLARFYAYDSYFLPTLRRHSEGGNPTWTWIVVAVGAALAAGIGTLARPRAGGLASAAALPFAGFTALITGLN